MYVYTVQRPAMMQFYVVHVTARIIGLKEHCALHWRCIWLVNYYVRVCRRSTHWQWFLHMHSHTPLGLGFLFSSCPRGLPLFFSLSASLLPLWFWPSGFPLTSSDLASSLFRSSVAGAVSLESPSCLLCDLSTVTGEELVSPALEGSTYVSTGATRGGFLAYTCVITRKKRTSSIFCWGISYNATHHKLPEHDVVFHLYTVHTTKYIL